MTPPIRAISYGGGVQSTALLVLAAQRRIRDAVDNGSCDTKTESTNAGAHVGAAWIKRKGKVSRLDGYVVMDGATFLALLGEAGYQ